VTASTSAIASRLAAVRATIAAACERVGRDPGGVTLVGVSKTHPVETVREALAAGLDDLGENRAQELVPKAEAAGAAGLTPRWHFIGHLQRNKVRQVLPHVAVLHSLDSTRLAEEIERRRPAALPDGAARPLPCYVEVNVAGEEQKHGAAPDALPALLADVARCTQLEVVGLMTVAPRAPEPEQLRPVFQRLRELANAQGLDGLSMGMTEDYAVAVEEGSTVVRVGRAIFGERLG
jgi:pyridoxal phosphate enzyme (YggS family)